MSNRQIVRSTRIVDLVNAVTKYAEEHYSEQGWDTIVECYDFADIVKVIGKARTVSGAIAKMKAEVALRIDCEQENEPMEGYDY